MYFFSALFSKLFCTTRIHFFFVFFTAISFSLSFNPVLFAFPSCHAPIFASLPSYRLSSVSIRPSAFTAMAAKAPDVWIHCGNMKSGVYGLKLLSSLGFRPKATLQVPWPLFHHWLSVATVLSISECRCTSSAVTLSIFLCVLTLSFFLSFVFFDLSFVFFDLSFSISLYFPLTHNELDYQQIRNCS